ncbi:nuclear transport factor 2 [Thelephora terrestris]|uniref:Nuclear transport factor 2 n=1 Tax=Thelephora terrestris TaxID=56493 RepID=A0A9P6HRS3_9AGAM|nr:nuclear transport factor 2 [Thelephora terrestris]
MAHFTTVAERFTAIYYSTFDRNRSELFPLYRDRSMLTWENTQHLGARAIIEKLSNLPFTTVQHKITTQDAQPSSESINSIIVLVTGLLVVDGSENPLQFSQVFHLIPEGESFWVFNDVFRLNYG